MEREGEGRGHAGCEEGDWSRGGGELAQNPANHEVSSRLKVKITVRAVCTATHTEPMGQDPCHVTTQVLSLPVSSVEEPVSQKFQMFLLQTIRTKLQVEVVDGGT